jgi:hypothetical protein
MKIQNKGSLILILALSLLISNCSKKDGVTKQNTALKITAVDDVGLSIAGATVKLYASQTDYSRDKNVIFTKNTDASGNTTFNDLPAIQYYWRVTSGCKNNQITTSTSTSALTNGITNTVSVQLKSMGLLKFVNNSTNPYYIYINGVVQSNAIEGNSIAEVNAPTGNYTIRVLQKSGYLVSPTDKSYTGSLLCGNTLSTTFPN